jgi:hypothetical protein
VVVDVGVVKGGVGLGALSHRREILQRQQERSSSDEWDRIFVFTLEGSNEAA